MQIKKGDIVLVSAHVATARRETPIKSRGETLLHRPNSGLVRTCLFRAPITPYRALIVGRSHLQTGSLEDAERGPFMSCDKAHIVLCVTPMDTERYLKPAHVLEADCKLLLRTTEPQPSPDFVMRRSDIGGSVGPSLSGEREPGDLYESCDVVFETETAYIRTPKRGTWTDE